MPCLLWGWCKNKVAIEVTSTFGGPLVELLKFANSLGVQSFAQGENMMGGRSSGLAYGTALVLRARTVPEIYESDLPI